MNFNTQYQFDFDGPTLAEAGLKEAVDHAEGVNPGWKERTYKIFKEEFLPVNQRFMLESFRSFLAMKDDYVFPPSARAFGAIAKMALKDKLIHQVGYGKVTNPRAHTANAAVWERK